MRDRFVLAATEPLRCPSKCLSVTRAAAVPGFAVLQPKRRSQSHLLVAVVLLGSSKQNSSCCFLLAASRRQSLHLPLVLSCNLAGQGPNEPRPSFWKGKPPPGRVLS